MMLRPLERIYKIPSILNSKRAKRKVSQLKAFHLLDPADQSILLEKEKVLVRHRVCIDELETRFLAVQGDIREKKQMIKRIEAGDPEGIVFFMNFFFEFFKGVILSQTKKIDQKHR